MLRTKRFAWTLAAVGVFATAGLVGACDPEDDPTPGTQNDAGTNKPDSGTNTDAGSNTDAGTNTDAGSETDAGTTTDAGSETDAGTTTDAGTQTTLPLAVDGTWAASGYMGDGSTEGLLVDEPVCATPRPGSGLGACHKFTYKKGGNGWAGVFWQYPEGNWSKDTPPKPGFLVPDGAKAVTFYAWSEKGGETVDFFVGYGPNSRDGFEVKLSPQAVLTTAPTKYTLDISKIRYADVAAGFGWSAGGLDEPFVFYIDDIQWQ
ncbi:hypothetical protein ACIHQR_19875 [Corallococcus coralloides]|uniref:hypothetical protein n=1 Tax=Corallococcus coralloides TaxID=184914 RepID=UPI00384D0D51